MANDINAAKKEKFQMAVLLKGATMLGYPMKNTKNSLFP